jgi:hypothetical protein
MSLLSADHYLNTSYSPDLEFVDGVPTLLEIEGELISTADNSFQITRSEIFGE